MSRNKPKRRWLQFSLRSVLLLTLAVALWLGYEVRQARQVEGSIAATERLGGKAERELSGWSVLRLCHVAGYGWRVVRAEIPGNAAQEAIEALRQAPGLREVQVNYDGTFDPAPSWKALIALRNVAIEPRIEEEHPALARFYRLRPELTKTFPNLTDDTPYSTGPWKRLTYRTVRLADGSLAELFTGDSHSFFARRQDGYLAVLMVEGKCVDLREFVTLEGAKPPNIVLEDLDGDGAEELAFQWADKRMTDTRVFQLPGDAREWLGVYKINRDGFTSLMPNDQADYPPPKRPPVSDSRR